MALHQDDLKLVARLIAGEKSAAARFAQLADQSVWSAVVVLVGDNAEGEEAYLAVIKALSDNGFARLKRYDGRSNLSGFLLLEARNCLAERNVSLFASNPDKAWLRLERLYKTDIARLAAKHFPEADGATREDLVSDVKLQLIEDNYRRIRAYRGDKAFGGYLLTVVANLMRDLKRQQTGRLRLPERIERLSPLHQAAFRAGAWRRVALDVRSMLAAIHGEIEPEPTPGEMKAALDEIVADILAVRDARYAAINVGKPISLDAEEGSGAINVPDFETPEAVRIRSDEEKAIADRLTDALKRADQDLRPLDCAYLRVLVEAGGDVPKASKIAELLGVPVEQVYGCQTRIKRWGARLAEEMKKNVEASV
jgi:RNA polymerase sigma factor (sigma-70 family)